MHQVLWIESDVRALLDINGQFCGPVDGEGQAFPAGRNAEIYIRLFPFAAPPMTAELRLRDGEIETLEPQDGCYALVWPDGVIQLELRPAQGDALPPAKEEKIVPGTLLRYLSMRLAGAGEASSLLMRPQEAVPDLSAYTAAVPLRFAPMAAGSRFDDRAGLVRRIAPNAAKVDTALAVTSPAGQGHRLIERIEILRTE